jgi:hypothetical protein
MILPNTRACTLKKYALLVRSPHRSGPKAELGSTALWSGAPNRSMVGGPPSHSAISRRSQYEVHRAATNPTYNPSDRGSTGAAGSTTNAAADVLLHHPYTVPSTTSSLLPQRHPHRAGAVPATSTLSRGSPRDGQPVGTVPLHC